MSVGRVGGGGGRGGPKGPKGVGGKGPVSGGGKVSFGGKVGKAESLVGPSGVVGSSNVGTVGPTDPVSAQAMEIVRQLKSGEIKSRDEAKKKLVATLLREKLHMKSKLLTDRIADALQDDPHSSQVLDRILSKG